MNEDILAVAWRWDKVVAVARGPRISNVHLTEGENYKAVLVFSEGARVVTDLSTYEAGRMLDHFMKYGKLP